jgi:hypothetical protein
VLLCLILISESMSGKAQLYLSRNQYETWQNDRKKSGGQFNIHSLFYKITLDINVTIGLSARRRVSFNLKYIIYKDIIQAQISAKSIKYLCVICIAMVKVNKSTEFYINKTYIIRNAKLQFKFLSTFKK